MFRIFLKLLLAHLHIDQPYILFNYLHDEGFVDIFDLGIRVPPLSTCWTNRVVDHILLYKIDPRIQILDAVAHHCDFSDHLPLILDFRISS